MKFSKNLRNRLISTTLSLGVLGITIFGAIHIFNNNDLNVCSKPSSVYIQRIDENHARLNCDSLKVTENDLLFSKSKVSGEYQYDISNFNSQKRLCSFKSKDDIVINDGLSRDSTLCSAIAAAVAAPTVASVAGAVGATGAAAISAAPVVGAVAGAGATSAAAGIGWAAGAGVAAATAVAAAPVAVVGGAIFGALTVG